MNYTELSLSSGHVAWENGQNFATPPREEPAQKIHADDASPLGCGYYLWLD